MFFFIFKISVACYSNKACYVLINVFRSKILLKEAKILQNFNKTCINYSSENWNSNKNEEKRLEVFERRVVRSICGPVFQDGEWRKQYNKNLCENLQQQNITNIMKSKNSNGQGM